MRTIVRKRLFLEEISEAVEKVVLNYGVGLREIHIKELPNGCYLFEVVYENKRNNLESLL